MTGTVNSTTSAAPLVSSVSYAVSPAFAGAVYASCADVVNPATSGGVLGLLCGPWGELCTPGRLFDFLGDLGNGNTPFQIDFEFVGDGSKQ